MTTVGEQLVQWLEIYGVDTVFGIPGVHTVEMYRGLAASPIRHLTPRHEQGAGFMADGHWRATGRVAACFVITGPGLTNILTPMAQAHADSVPMLVVSSVNRARTLGLGEGDLHEIANQGIVAAQAAAFSHRLSHPAQLGEVLARAWAVFEGARPRPVHLEIPVDMFSMAAEGTVSRPSRLRAPQPPGDLLSEAMAVLEGSRQPVLIAGGGAVEARVGALAEHLDAPVVMTTNGRGLLAHDHPLAVPASPSLAAVRRMIAEADAVLAIGTEIGRTDFDMYDRGGFEVPGQLIRIEIDAEQMRRGARPDLPLLGDARVAVDGLLGRATAPRAPGDGAARAAACLAESRGEVGPAYARIIALLEQMRETLPEAPIVCDSTQAAYAGNLLFGAPAPRHWFNASTGYGALGYGLPAAIGACHGLKRPVICIAGDGGLQFTLAELGLAVEEGLPLILLVWDNQGYGEIKSYMLENGIAPVGVDLHTPDFLGLARAYGAAAARVERIDALPDLIRTAAGRAGPSVLVLDEALALDRQG
ncbi:MAG: 5-guanidino-2-oxopentanoate decarboxylase [Pseudomonadota bacterium]